MLNASGHQKERLKKEKKEKNEREKEKFETKATKKLYKNKIKKH